MNRCKTCSWWAPNRNGPHRESGAFACKNPKLTTPVSEIHFDHPDGACGDEELGQPFVTGPEFGCVHHSTDGTVAA